jgi:hypothetical protein
MECRLPHCGRPASNRPADFPTLLVVPAQAGTQGQTLSRQLTAKIEPSRIMALDQHQFPRTAPLLDALFAEDRTGHGLVKLDKH